MQNLFVTLESTEGAGKGTAAPFLRACFTAAGHDVVSTREVGGTPMAELMREAMLHNIDFNISAMEETLMAMAGRLNHVRTLINPAMAGGRTVISERYMDSTRIYQGIAGGVPKSVIDYMWNLMYLPTPNLTFLMDIDPEVGFKRALDSARKLDRIECRPIEFFHKVRDGYLTLVKEDTTGRFRIIDAERPLPEVRAQFITHLVTEGIMHPEEVNWIKRKYDVAS